jgi:hypothetical protein
MMKARRILSAIASMAVALGLASPAVSAAPPTPVEIVAHPCSFAPETGEWSASGAITDSGTFARSDLAVSPPNAGLFEARTYREEFVFTGFQGTFTVRAEERTSAPEGQTGVWQIAAGTGAYAEVSGHGESFFAATPGPSCWGPITFTFTLTGVLGKAD